MKSLRQAETYISECAFSDADWPCVLDFFRNTYSASPDRPHGETPWTWESFLLWHESMPGAGDIVEFGTNIGVVGRCFPGVYELCTYMSYDWRPVNKPLRVPANRVKPVYGDKLADFRADLRSNKLEYSERLGRMVDMFKPSDGDFVSVSSDSGKRMGIFRAERGGSYVFYYLEGGGSSVPVKDCSLRAASTTEAIRMHDTFALGGKRWNARKHVFEAVPTRAKLGDTYWYITDKFYVSAVKDARTATHNERFKNGNYFTSYASALSFLARLKGLVASAKGNVGESPLP